MSERHPVLVQLPRLEKILISKGFPPMSPWWKSVIERFYKSGKRQLCIRAGRRAGKSSTLSRVAVLDGLYGGHTVPTGDTGIIGFISVNRAEANARLKTIREILEALGIRYRTIDGGLEVPERNIVFRVFAATLQGVVGGTWICGLCDELALWRDGDSGVNPATEILGQLRPTMATMPRAKLFLSSSPMGQKDAHAVAYDQGETERQSTAHCPSWVGNPTLSEEECRKDEPHEPTFLRQYAAIPQNGGVGCFDVAHFDACSESNLGLFSFADQPVVVLDASGGQHDSFTWTAAAWCKFNATSEQYWDWDPITHVPIPLPTTHKKKPDLRLLMWRQAALDGKFGDKIDFSAVIARIADTAHQIGATKVVGDQFSAWALTGELKKHHLEFVCENWTNTKKAEAVASCRRMMRDRILAFHECEESKKLRAELEIFEQVVTPSGLIKYGAKRNGHDDRVATMITMALAEETGLITGSPYRRRSFKHIIEDHEQPIQEF